jgi:hypothetical protein
VHTVLYIQTRATDIFVQFITCQCWGDMSAGGAGRRRPAIVAVVREVVRGTSLFAREAQQVTRS